MEYNITSMNEQIAYAISKWNYEGKYAIYNTESFEEMKKKKASLVNEEKFKNYMCFFDKYSEELIGYINIIKKENNDIFIGIGLAPNKCGRGLGNEMLKCGIKEAKERYPGAPIILQVRSWNERAIKCYIKAGFKITRKENIKDYKGNLEEFTFMKYDY